MIIINMIRFNNNKEILFSLAIYAHCMIFTDITPIKKWLKNNNNSHLKIFSLYKND